MNNPMMTYEEKMCIVATQIDILDSYHKEGSKSRRKQALSMSQDDMFNSHLPSHTDINDQIIDFSRQIDFHKSYSPHITSKPEMQEKLKELEGRLTSTACQSL